MGDERRIVKSTGRAFEQKWAHVITMRDGRCARGFFIDDTAAQVVALGAAQEGDGASSDAASGNTAGTEIGPEAAAAQPTGD